jgi:Ca2+-binding RTX toxin-like protein
METTMLKFPVTSTNDTTITFQLNPTTFGTSGADVLFGKDFAPRFWWDTWSYDDELFGFGGSDKLFGGAGARRSTADDSSSPPSF